jgi:hypothetical protein
MPNKELVQKEKTELAVVNEADFFDDAIVSDANDILIPKILLMHGTSTLVGQQKANQGDIIDSVSLEGLANSKKTIEFIPIKQLDKVWNIERWNGKKFEYERTDPWNSDLMKDREFAENGQKKRRNARLSFYVLLARDAKTMHLPYLISFQRTSYSAGRNIASFFREAQYAFRSGDKNAIPMGQVFELGCHVEQGDNGSYFVMDCKRTRLASPFEKEKGIYWFKQLKVNQYKVHDESETASEVDSDDVREF